MNLIWKMAIINILDMFHYKNKPLKSKSTKVSTKISTAFRVGTYL